MLPAEAGLLEAEEMDSTWSGRTSISSSSTSRPASSSIRHGHERARLHGLLAHDAAGGDEDRPGIVHRLDRDTSGLLVVARSDEAHARLQELIRRRAVERRYLAWSRARRAPGPAGSRRRSAATGSTRRATRSTRRPRATPSLTWVVELLGRARCSSCGSRPAHTPDPRPPRGDRAADLGRPVYGSAAPGLERSSCTQRGSHSTIRSPASRSRSSRRFRTTSRQPSSAPAQRPDRRYTSAVVVPSSRRPGRWGCRSCERFRPRPAGCTAVNREKGQSLGSRIHA